MALPAGVTTATFTFGKDFDVLGESAAVSLKITPSHTLIWSATGDRITAFEVSTEADAGTIGSFELPHTDQEGFVNEAGDAITDWWYTIVGTTRIGRDSKKYTKRVQVTSDVETVDLDTLPINGTVGPVGSVALPTITSVNGSTGVVVLSAADVGAVPNTEAGRTALAASPELGAAYVPQAKVAYNPLTGDHALGLRAAIADGTTHPLSERFGTLAAAQAVFPRATALTEEIDRHAIQWGLDNYGHVDCPGGRTYLIDSTIYTSAGDALSPRGLGNQVFRMFGTIKVRDGVTSTTWFASGNSRTHTFGANVDSATAPECPNLTIYIHTLDGNRDNITPASNTFGVYLRFASYADVDIFVKNVGGGAFANYGVSDGYTYGVSLTRVYAENCAGEWAVRCDLRNRYVTYNDVKVWDCDNGGVFWDHSESVSHSIQAWDNGGEGICVRNQSRNIVNGLRASRNGMNGIRLSGTVNAVGGDWISMDNGTASVPGVTEYADLYLDNASGSYGLTGSSRFHDIILGRRDLGEGEGGWALYIEDGIVGDVSLEGVKVIKIPGLGTYRLPATTGNLRVELTPPNTSTPSLIAGVSSGPVTRWKSAAQTINNSDVLTNITDLGVAVAANQKLLVEWTLHVQSATTEDIKLGLSYPTPMQGRWGIVAGLDTAQTGGSGSARPISLALASTAALGTGNNPITLIKVMAILDVGSTSGTVYLQFAQNVAAVADTKVLNYSSVTVSPVS
ncbi:hypothetical protein [Microbacterium schleiferi]|uniref:hypothetical protein n=1 Tax=Microbacterium schleiferi TaxID=69362 RepID=UPI001D17395B|nr:hypothetical protein [Microbacterium schleiferi]MCC4266237.1 hypothetical protein [Microbacterium schleiferi]